MVAMFSKEEEGARAETPNTGSGESQTIIGPTVKVEGAFASDDNILIEGHVIGTITTTKNLTVGVGAQIEADVTAANMNIAGKVKGNLHASESIQLTSSAEIVGDIETNIISIETGASVQGRCVSGQAKSTAPKKEAELEEAE